MMLGDRMKKFKDVNIQKIINILAICYFFFLSRRGGDTKDKLAILLVFSIFTNSIKLNNYKKYLLYKKEIFIGIVYIFFVSISFFLSTSKEEDRFYTYTHATFFSIGFFLLVLNYSLNKNYLKYIIPILFLISIPSVFNGMKDLYFHYDILKNYRISGYTYTTVYALEIGIYFIITFFSFLYYRNKYLKLLFLIYLGIISILIIGTQSRNTFLMLPISLVLITFIKNYKKGILVLLILVIFSFLMAKSPLKIKNVERIKISITSIEKIKKDARYLLFKEGLELSKNNIIKGDGFFKYKGKNIKSNAIEAYQHYHNIFIETAVTQGILALLSYIIFLFTLFYRLVKNYFIENNELKKNIKLMTVVIFIFSHLYGLAEPIFYFEKIYQLIFTIIAISVVIDDLDSDKERKEKNDINIRS